MLLEYTNKERLKKKKFKQTSCSQCHKSVDIWHARKVVTKYMTRPWPNF